MDKLQSARMALVALIDLDDPLDARAGSALDRALREAGVARTVPLADAAKLDGGDRVLLVGAGTLLEPAMLAAMADGAQPMLATLPNDLPHTHRELIDGATRWAGWAALPGAMVAETAQTLDPEWSLASTLVRRAVQGGALRVDAARSGALIALDAPDAVAAVDLARLRQAMQPRTGASGPAVEWLARRIAERALDVKDARRWAVGAAYAFLAGTAVALSQGWMAAAALAFLLLVLAARVARGLRLAAGLAPPRVERLTDAVGLAALGIASAQLWWLGGGWGVAVLAIVTAADVAMAAADEAALGEPLIWRADAPAIALILLFGALVAAPVPALAVSAAWASASFAVLHRKLLAGYQRLSSGT